MWGFLNFLFGLGCALCGTALWLAFEKRRASLRVLTSTIVALICFFSHLAAFGIYALAIVSNDQAPNAPMFLVRAVEPESALADVDAAVEWLKKGYTDHNKDVKFRDVQKTKLGGEDALLFSMDDRPIVSALDLYREEEVVQ